MSFPDGTAVIRYYPVEVDPDWKNSDAAIGLGVWISPSSGGSNLTMIAADGGESPEWTWDYPGAPGYLSTLMVPRNMTPGGYAERAFQLLDESGVIVPISVGTLPLQLYLSRATSEWQGGYAGGIIQIGLYQAGELVELASFQVRGYYFSEMFVVPGGWEVIPPANPGSIDDSTEYTRVNLAANIPVLPFWTQLKQAVEI